MNEHQVTPEQLQAYSKHLYLGEKSAATIEKYLRMSLSIRALVGRPRDHKGTDF